MIVSSGRPVRVLVADDHEIVREGLRLMLGEQDGIELVGESSSGEDAVRQTLAISPDVVLMDLVMPGVSGIEAARRIRDAGSPSRVLILTSYGEDDRVREAVQAGVIGYILKDVRKDDLLAAILAAARGLPTLSAGAQRLLMQHVAAPPALSPLDSLTPRERDVLRLIAGGAGNKQIAGALHLSVGTVKGYVSALFAKLGVQDRTQAALLAVREGLEPLALRR
jgi:two-component system, NarL family, response regulator LiaR